MPALSLRASYIELPHVEAAVKDKPLFPLRQFATLAALLLTFASPLALPPTPTTTRSRGRSNVGAGPGIPSAGPRAAKTRKWTARRPFTPANRAKSTCSTRPSAAWSASTARIVTGPTRSLTLPDGLEPTDMIATDNGLVVWDGKPISLEPKGEGLSRSLTVTRDAAARGRSRTHPVDVQPDGLAGPRLRRRRPDGRDPAAIKGAEDEPVGPIKELLATRGAGPVAVVTTPDASRHEVELVVTSRVAGRTRAAEAQGARAARQPSKCSRSTRSAACSCSSKSSRPAAAKARRRCWPGSRKNSQFEGIYELPLAPDVALARRFVTVSPDGDVYFLRTRKGVVDVLGVGFRPMKKNSRSNWRQSRPIRRSWRKRSRRVGQQEGHRRASSRSPGRRVIETAFGFEGIRWRLTPASSVPNPTAPARASTASAVPAT